MADDSKIFVSTMIFRWSDLENKAISNLICNIIIVVGNNHNYYNLSREIT